MNVLIACEFSGIVRDAFRIRGHNAWSCDVLPSEGNHTWHLQGDVRRALDGSIPFDMVGDSAYRDTPVLIKWDLLIAHPPCTYLCNSGVRWLAPGGKLDTERHKQMMVAADFFAALYHAPIPRVCIENPIMHKYARDYLQSAWKVPTYSQIIQPHQFGHGETKATCLWLKGLPLLQPTKIVEGRTPRVHHASPSPDRWKERSRTLPGIAGAMADQWTPGSLLWRGFKETPDNAYKDTVRKYAPTVTSNTD